MSQIDTAHAWWSRLRHQGLLLSPVVMVERYPTAPPEAKFPSLPRLRDARTRFESQITSGKPGAERDQGAILGFTDALLESFVGHTGGRLAKQGSIPENLTAIVRIGSRSDTIRPHRVVFADEAGVTPALLVMADPSPHVGRGRGRTVYSRFLELLRGTGHRLGLLTNGQQFRLIYAGLDFESWCEWETDRWFDEGEGTEELCGLRQLLSPESLKPIKEGVSGLLDGVEESRKRQADLSSVLRENVRQAVELLLEEVSTANRSKPELFGLLVSQSSDRKLTDAEAHEALFQATVRVVMRLVVCLFAESRQLLPINDPIYGQSYGVRSLYELLDEVTRFEGGTHALFNRQAAWHRLMALFRLIYIGSAHGAFPMQAYGGVLFRPGDEYSPDAVARALHVLEHSILVGDATIYHVLRKLLRGPLPVIKGKSKTFVDGPVDYTDLRTEFIGLIYEGLLDYRLKRTDEKIGPQIFLNLGREPVLPLARLKEMLQSDKKGLKDLLTTLRKEKVTATAADEEEEIEGETEDDADAETTEELVIETDEGAVVLQRTGDYLDSVEAAKRWAREAVVLASLIGTKKAREPDSEYQARIEAEATKLIKRVVATGEFYLVRAGNTRKGTGTFYTRPQLAVPTVHRTLEPLCYDKAADGTLMPKKPEDILALKVCDPACGSASFLVAALHYLTDALYKSLCHHRKLEDPAQSKKITLPYGQPRTDKEGEELIPFPPNDPQRGDTFAERIKALLRRHVVERCIYGVDINALAVELARVSLWVETLDPDLPFSFLDHKIKVGNSLVGCWLDRVQDYPLKAWEREGGDGKAGLRTLRIETFLKGDKVGKRRTGDGIIKRQMREVIQDIHDKTPTLFNLEKLTTEKVITQARQDYEKLHDLSVFEPDERERIYREEVQKSPTVLKLKLAMDEWCSLWFWPTDDESFKSPPLPLRFLANDKDKLQVVKRLAIQHKFFHWEIEYPDVFTPERRGFDSVLGNPPWEVMKPISQEFFTEYDPLYRTYDKQTALRHQRQMFDSVEGVQSAWADYNATFKAWSNWVKNAARPFDLTLSRGSEGAALAKTWEVERRNRLGYSAAEKPFTFQGSADLNSYKLFLEVGHHLLTAGGRLGFIVPSGLYTDAGCHDIRELFLNRSTWEWLFGFINWESIFNIYYRFKFVCTVVERRTPPGDHAIRSCFGRYKLRDWEEAESIVFPLPKRNIVEFSPKTLSILEITNQRDLDICRKIYANSFRIGDKPPGWQITYACEFHMTNDSKHFSPLEKWKERGFQPDAFGRWIGAEGEVALPLYEGRMIGQFDFSQKGYVSGRGRSAVWRELPFNNKTVEPQFMVPEATFSTWEGRVGGTRLGYMSIGSSTNSRTGVACALPELPCGNSVSVLSVDNGNLRKTLYAAGVISSLAYDYALRARVGGINLNWFILEESALPRPPLDERDRLICRNAARLTFVHRRFAPDWLKLRVAFAEFGAKEWKHWWAITASDRLRLWLEIDALSADLYGLTADDLDWIVRDDPTDPKGFHRVDKHLPHRERLTGLAAAAFRALKEGKWFPESAAKLTNDEFFEIIGIPEMTSPSVAKAMTLPEPLILKRDGCHNWEPEKFGRDDPRHGWTWNDCWNDAVALLGSEEAVRRYVSNEKPSARESNQRVAQPDLFSAWLPKDVPSFIEELYRMDSGKEYDAVLDNVFLSFDGQFAADKFEFCDDVLSRIEVERLSIDTLIGLLSASFPAKHSLDERSGFFERVATRINAEYDRAEALRLLAGLS
jgi:hypothetical protein